MKALGKITLKALVELESEINSGKTAHAAGINHGFASVRLLEPGKYIADLETTMGAECQCWTGKDETHTLVEFIDDIKWDDTDSFDLEYRTYMGQQIWFIGDVDPWNTDLFVWPENHVDSFDIIWSSQDQAKANREKAFNALLGDIEVDL